MKVGRTYQYENGLDQRATGGPDSRGDSELSTSHLCDSMKDDIMAWVAFSRFFDHAWFTRVWVVQEMLPNLQTHLMSRKVGAALLCGTHLVDWRMVFHAALWAWDAQMKGHYRPVHHDLLVDGVMHTIRMDISAFIRFAHVLSPGPPARTIGRHIFEILQLLRNFRNREATDPRDKLFGLFGLSNFDNDMSGLIAEAKIPIDYNLPVMETYRNFARAHIKDAFKRSETENHPILPPGHPGHCLDILYDTAPRSKELQWPSWVPDWRSEGCYGHIYFPVTLPSRSLSAKISGTLHEHPDPNCLVVNGIILGRVLWTHEGHHMEQVSESDPRAVGKFIASQIGPQYKYGSVIQKTHMNSHQDSTNSQQRARSISNIADTKSTEGALVTTYPDGSSNRTKNLDGGAGKMEDMDTKEDTETAFLWTLTLNELAPTFAHADFSRDEYAHSQILYDCFDLFRAKAGKAPLNFTETQIENVDRIHQVQVRVQGTSNAELMMFLHPCPCDRRLFFTDSGYIGIGHDDLQVGDDAAILFGMGTTCILRPFVMDNGERAHELIGNAWIRGANHGEVVEEMYKNGQLEPGKSVGQRITLR